MSSATSTPGITAALPQAPPGAAPSTLETPAHPGHRHVWMSLTKARLSGLVVATTAVGLAVAPGAAWTWWQAAGVVLGTALAAASAAMLNQLVEVRRDALMHRTRSRPLPAGHVGRMTVFVVGVAAGYAGVSLVALASNVLAAALTAGTILVYVLMYTPLKPLTTFNTLVGAVCGATPPMIGWAAATGGLEPGASVLGSILFVWQIPHFFALAWVYRDDYRRGGFMMLPVLDDGGRTTTDTILMTSLLMVPLSLLATLFGLAGAIYSAAAILLGVWLSWRALRLWRTPSDAAARRVFLATVLYLPLLLAAMVADRGPMTLSAALRAGAKVAAPAAP